MNPAGQWYYLSGSNPMGPIAQTKLFEMIRSGELIPSVQVAAVGWQQWQPASSVFPELLASPSPAQQPMPAPQPQMSPTQTIVHPQPQPQPQSKLQTQQSPTVVQQPQPQ